MDNKKKELDELEEGSKVSFYQFIYFILSVYLFYTSGLAKSNTQENTN